MTASRRPAIRRGRPYGEGKRAAETLFFDYHRRLGTGIKVTRLINTYGPRMQSPAGRARELLGWAPTVGLRDGLSRTIEYFSDRKD